MIKKIVKINGKDVKFKSSATIPRLYRIKFKRDIFKDLSKLEKSYMLPEILELWGTNLQTDIKSKKNFKKVAGK